DVTAPSPSDGDALVRAGSVWSPTAVIPASQKGAANGVASLGSDGKVPSSQVTLDTTTLDGRYLGTFTTPELFGAVGDGTTDDTAALESTLSAGKRIELKKGKTYLC